TFCTQCLKSACLVFIHKMTFFKLLKCTVAKPPICCSCFCNEQLNKNVKCGKEYFTLNVSNIVLVIFKSFITFCWEKKRIKKKNRISNRNILVKNRNSIIFPNRSALLQTPVSHGKLSPETEANSVFVYLCVCCAHVSVCIGIPLSLVTYCLILSLSILIVTPLRSMNRGV